MRKNRHPLRTAFALTLVVALGAIALVSSASGDPGRSSAARAASAVPGEILVGFKAPVSSSAQTEVLARFGAVRKRRFAGIRGALVSVDPQHTAETIRSLERDRRVAYAEPNFVLRTDAPNDPFMSRLWGLDNLGQTVNWTAGAPDADIDAREAWSVSTGSPDVVGSGSAGTGGAASAGAAASSARSGDQPCGSCGNGRSGSGGRRMSRVGSAPTGWDGSVMREWPPRGAGAAPSDDVTAGRSAG